MRSWGSHLRQQSNENNENNETVQPGDMETLCNTCDTTSSVPALSVQSIVPCTGLPLIQYRCEYIGAGQRPQQQSTIFCLCIISIIRLQVSTWTTVVLQYNVSGWPRCCMSRLWYAILHCASCSRADCGVWRHKNVPIQLSSQRSESRPGYYTCFYPVNMNIVTAFFSQMYNT